MAASPNLFEVDLPPGLQYVEEFITKADERVLLDSIADVAFSDFEMRGVVAGISLLSACRMKFRRYISPAAPKPPRRSATHEIVLERSPSCATR